jgi:hypothetical protein
VAGCLQIAADLIGAAEIGVAGRRILVKPHDGGEYSANAVDVYWQPLSLWKMTLSGLRCARVISSAAVTRSVRMWSASAHPTTFREWRSITVARYIHPCQVRTY